MESIDPALRPPPIHRACSNASTKSSAASTTASARSRRTPTGLNASFSSTTSGTQWTWAPRRSRRFSLISRSIAEVSAATQNQAQCALLFLYREVLGVDLPWLDNVERAKRPVKLPVVLTIDEVTLILERLTGTHRLIGRLMYGAGLAHSGGAAPSREGRRLPAPRSSGARRQGLQGPRHDVAARRRYGRCATHLKEVWTLHQQDLDDGFGAVWMPYALARKFPAAPREWAWQYVFPADRRSKDPRGGVVRRHHLGDQAFQRAMRQAVLRRAHPQAGHAAHAAPLVRHAPARIGLRHPHRAGTARPFQREHDDDLHARAQPRRARRGESSGPACSNGSEARLPQFFDRLGQRGGHAHAGRAHAPAKAR